MLTLEYLLEEAKSNALPVQKRRAIIREYLQIIALNSIYKHNAGKKMFFMGGTALRYFYNMPRFSEDLDFNASNLGESEFDGLLTKLKDDLSKEGFSAEIRNKSRDNLFVANLEFKDVIKAYKITDERSVVLVIKVKVNQPKWELNIQAKVLSMYGYNFSAVLMSEGNLLSEKVCALLNRRRGRDIYDTLFMLRKQFPFNEKVLKFNKIKLPVEDTILEYLRGLAEKELKFLAEQVRPFLFKEEDVELVLKARDYAEEFLKKYK